MSDYFDERVPLDNSHLASINAQAESNSARELQRIRDAQAKEKAAKARREREAASADAERREQEQVTMKATVEGWFLLVNPWATKGDFTAEWSKSKLSLIRDYQQFVQGAGRLPESIS